MGEVNRLQGNLAEAEARYKQALEADPSYTDAQLQLSDVYRAQGKTDEAAAALDQALQAAGNDPGAAAALTKQGNVLAEAGNTDEAIASYRQAIEVNPAYAGSYLQLGALYETQEKTDDALKVYEDGIAAAPDNAVLRLRLRPGLPARGSKRQGDGTDQPGHGTGPDVLAGAPCVGRALRGRQPGGTGVGAVFDHGQPCA